MIQIVNQLLDVCDKVCGNEYLFIFMVLESVICKALKFIIDERNHRVDMLANMLWVAGKNVIEYFYDN